MILVMVLLAAGTVYVQYILTPCSPYNADPLWKLWWEEERSFFSLFCEYRRNRLKKFGIA
jgi:hypothetical protein